MKLLCDARSGPSVIPVREGYYSFSGWKRYQCIRDRVQSCLKRLGATLSI
jgi:hypothetical protein